MTALASSKRRLKCPVCERMSTANPGSKSTVQLDAEMRAHKAFRRKNTAATGRSGERTNPPKFDNKNNILQWPKTGSSLSANGPINLLGGGSWKWAGQGSSTARH